MTFLFSMPSSSELIFLFLVLIALLMMPILAIVYHARYKEQKKQVQQHTAEKTMTLQDGLTQMKN